MSKTNYRRRRLSKWCVYDLTVFDVPSQVFFSMPLPARPGQLTGPKPGQRSWTWSDRDAWSCGYSLSVYSTTCSTSPSCSIINKLRSMGWAEEMLKLRPGYYPLADHHHVRVAKELTERGMHYVAQHHAYN